MELADFSYIKSKISRLHVGLSMYAVTPREDSRFYRGVIYKEKPTSVDSLSYPPKNIVKNFQRCNRPENPMFYCSVDPSAALFELRVQPEDKVYLSKWSLKQDFWVNRLAVDDDLDEFSTPIRAIILTFFETRFSQPVHETYSSQHKVTAAITEHMATGNLVEGRLIGGLGYPSVAHPSRSENIVIRPEVVDSCLKLDYVEEISILKVENNIISVSYTDFSSDFEGGNIHWSGSPKKWSLPSGAKFTLTAEPDGWVARDEDGNIVNPD